MIRSPAAPASGDAASSLLPPNLQPTGAVYSGQPLKPCRGAGDQALAEQAVQVLGHHLAFHVVIDEPGFFHFAIDQAAGHQPGQGLGGSQGFQQPGLPLGYHLVETRPGPVLKLRFGKRCPAHAP